MGLTPLSGFGLGLGTYIFVVDDIDVDIAGAASVPIESTQLANCMRMDLELERNHLDRSD
jgi:hypothetical protein